MKVKDLSTMLWADQKLKFVSAFDNVPLANWIDKFHDGFDKYENAEVKNITVSDNGLTFIIEDETEYLVRVSDRIGKSVVIKEEDDKLRLGQVLDVLDENMSFSVRTMDDREYMNESEAIDEDDRLFQVEKIKIGGCKKDGVSLDRLLIEINYSIYQE